MADLQLLPGALNLFLYRGDDEAFSLTITEGGVAAVLPTTGWSAQIRAKADPLSPVLGAFTIDATDAATGVLRLSILGTDTLALPRKAKWDIQCDTPSVRTYLAGDVIVNEQVTQ